MVLSISANLRVPISNIILDVSRLLDDLGIHHTVYQDGYYVSKQTVGTAWVINIPRAGRLLQLGMLTDPAKVEKLQACLARQYSNSALHPTKAAGVP